MFASFKEFLRRKCPILFNMLYEINQRRHPSLPYVASKVLDRYGKKVVEGPFKGMVYIDQARCSGLAPKLLGCYEAELQGIFANVLKMNYTAIVDIGCAEGYYAVGCALRFPRATIYAFDTDPEARHLCEALARTNGVEDRVVIDGLCDPAKLLTLPLNQSLIICDCEGYELELLQPDLVPQLRHCDMIVELHDCNVPNLTAALLPRFTSSHEITLINSEKRRLEDYPLAHFLTRRAGELAIDDLRCYPMQWAYLRAKSIR